MSVYSQLPKSAEVTLLEMSKVAIDDLKLEYNEVTNIRYVFSEKITNLSLQSRQ